MPINPEIKNLRERDSIGGASATIIRAEVNADDQINANAKPAKIARMSMGYFSLTNRKELRGVLHPEQDHSAPTRSDAHAKARAEDLARAFIKHVGLFNRLRCL
jgi:hypothetical protein